MTIIQVTSQELWDAFVSSLPYAQFTQSWAWGEFQSSIGREVVRIFILNDSEDLQSPLAAAQFIHQPRPLVGGYWLAPRGPVFSQDLSKEEHEEVLRTLMGQLSLPQSLFIRVEPPVMTGSLDLPQGFVPHRAYNPAVTSILDLTKSEDELLAAMHHKTRYNIRLAERHGVKVRLTDDIGTFLRLTKETSERDRFLAPEYAYLEKTYRELSKAGMARLRLAEAQNEVLAMSMEMVYGDTATYLHGASSSRLRDVMAPFALHWDAIKSAKAEGKKQYDFWGCNPDDTNHPNYKKTWEGITRFKLGWSGRCIEFAGTFDIPRQLWLYRALKKIGRV
ncbi:peptidoglycan bridge formation glycyltransferase FemA/FemB family protein [Patescibacteria group bacterium]|jgi:lipid II:glycine glycyltransferase (peptidoglycan interpeptide bridge formation enzyme)|nr:peptidoglycan bridge formation glycyltransferase FemA/FemB family protein [Patescibacteria group bacterium]